MRRGPAVIIPMRTEKVFNASYETDHGDTHHSVRMSSQAIPTNIVDAEELLTNIKNVYSLSKKVE